MDSYILKIYRKGQDQQAEVAGLLESVLSAHQVSFHNFQELSEVLLRDLGIKRHERTRTNRP